MTKLTGHTRHRVKRTLFGYKLILQVEVQSASESPIDFSVGPSYTYWRDARTEDLVVDTAPVEVHCG